MIDTKTSDTSKCPKCGSKFITEGGEYKELPWGSKLFCSVECAETFEDVQEELWHIQNLNEAAMGE